MVRSQLRLSCCLMAFLLLFPLAALAGSDRSSDHWRLHFNGKADQDGAYVIKMVPDRGDSESVRVKVDKGTRENEAAREAARVLRKESKGYDIDYEDGEEVQIRSRVGASDFVIKIEESVKGLNIKVDRERIGR